MQGRCANKGMNTGFLGMFHRIPAAVDIAKICPRQTAYNRVFATLGDFRNSIEVTLGCNWKTSLDNINAHFIQQLGNF